MTIINIRGNNNEINAILDSQEAVVFDNEDISGITSTGMATLDIPTIPETELFIFDISGNNHDVTTIHNSSSAVLTEGTNEYENNTITGITII